MLDLIVSQSNRATFTELERHALKRISDSHSLPGPNEEVAAYVNVTMDTNLRRQKLQQRRNATSGTRSN